MDLQNFLTTLSGSSEGSQPSGLETPQTLATISASFTTTDTDGFTRAADATLGLPLTDFTIAGWVKMSTDSVPRILLASGDDDTAAANLAWELQIFRQDTTFYLWLLLSDGSNIYQMDTKPSISVDTNWHFFVATFDHSTTIYTSQFDDGTVQSSSPEDSIDIPESTFDFFLGYAAAFTASGTPASDDKMCSVGIWNRVLDANEIASLYNAGTGAKLYEALTTDEKVGLVAYWNLDEVSDGTGAVTRLDSSGNGLDLTDVNTTPSAEDAP